MKKNKVILVLIILIISVFFSGCFLLPDYKIARTVYDNEEQMIKEESLYRLNNNTIGLNLELDSFYGIDTIYYIHSPKNCTVKFEYSSEVEKGSFKCILISPDKKITNILENNQKETKEFSLKKGKSIIRIVGKDDAIVKFKFNIKELKGSGLKVVHRLN